MSRKFNRQLQINKKAIEIMEDPGTIAYLAGKLIRKRPKRMPRIVWKLLLLIVLAPSTRKTPSES